MAGISDEAFARAVQQAGVVSYDQLEAAKAAQAESAAKGVLVPLADVLVQQGVMASATRENIEKKVRALQAGGIQQFGHFKLIKKLGEGGMGAVYLAEDTNAGRMVAIKLLPKKHAGDSEFLSRFRREARSAGQLNHVNIVAAHTVGEEMGNHYIVMEYVEGEPLDKTLKRGGSLPWDKAVEIVMQIARGLKHAHEHGIIHRDIKPANIIVTPNGVAKILDLGLSKTIGGDEHTFHTQTGVALGTPHYISPEQAKGEKNIDGRTDIYSLGATFYHLVTGMTPFEGSTAAVIMLKHLNEQLTNPQDIVEDLPDGVAHVIMRMMAKEPNDRYRDCKELLDDLELVIDGKDPSSHAIEVGKSSVAMPRAARPKRPAGVVQTPRRTAGPLQAVGAAGAPARAGTGPVGAAGAPARAGTGPVGAAGAPARRGTARRTGDATAGEAPATPIWKYVGIGVGVLGALVFILALSMGGGGTDKSETRNPKSEGNGETSSQKPAASSQKTAAQAEEARLKEMAAKLEAERQKLDADKRRAEEVKLAEERRKQEAARLAAEAEAKKKAAAAVAKADPPPMQPDVKTTQPDTKAGETPAVQTMAGEAPAVQTKAGEAPAAPDARAVKAQQAFSAVLKETAPLLAQNKFADAIALLERKAKDPALADAAELLKQEKADVEGVAELRRSAVEALRKQAGKEVTLKKGGTAFKGKVVVGSAAVPGGGTGTEAGATVTLDMGGAQMTFTATMLSLEDVDLYAPRTGNVGADLRARGIMYLAAGNAAKAKEFFAKPQTVNPEPYLDRITALELGEIEAAALKAWEKAERLFAAKDMKGAKAAYEAFEREHGKTQTAAKQAAAMKERYDAIEKVLGPAREIALDLGGGVKVEMVLIPAGTFTMGSPDNEPGREGDGREGPQHEVTITKPFYMGKYEVTVAQFRRFVEMTKHVTEAEKAGNKGWGWDNGWKELSNVNWKQPNFPQEDNHPVCLISWNDAQAFVSWASKATTRSVRLPTEAEWEYACRAKTTTRFYTGNDDKDLDKAGWFDGNSGRKTHPLGQKAANAFGLYDMHGNVWEWCEDRAQKDYYKESPKADPPGPMVGNDRVLRGGCWHNGPAHCRSARRGWVYPTSRSANHGFRLVVGCEQGASGAAADDPAKTAVAQPAAQPTTPADLQKEMSLNLGRARMDLVLVPAGDFDMGSNDGDGNEKPVHKVKISQPYYIGKYHVTVAQFRAFADAAKFQTEAEKQNKGWTVKDGKWQEVSGVHWRNPGFTQEDNHPVVVVTWNDAQDFCKWATKVTGRTVRLPTEAEWEYAARGPKGMKYPWGDKWEGITANVADASLRRAGFAMRWGEIKEDDGYPFTSPGGAFKNASWCGAFDMAGNAWHWCQDYWNDKYYAESPAVDPQGPATGGDRVLRGGRWFSVPAGCRSARRDHNRPSDRNASDGFRVVVGCGSSGTP